MIKSITFTATAVVALAAFAAPAMAADYFAGKTITILSGAVTVDYGDQGRRVYKAGTAFMEAMGVWHDGVNQADVPCRILIVFIGSTTAENVIRK